MKVCFSISLVWRSGRISQSLLCWHWHLVLVIRLKTWLGLEKGLLLELWLEWLRLQAECLLRGVSLVVLAGKPVELLILDTGEWEILLEWLRSWHERILSWLVGRLEVLIASQFQWALLELKVSLLLILRLVAGEALALRLLSVSLKVGRTLTRKNLGIGLL